MEVAPRYASGVFRAQGSYLKFTQKRDEYLAQQDQYAAALANKVRGELDWAARSPKARTGKASFRLKEAVRLHSELKEIRSRSHTEDINCSFTESGRQTRELVKLIEVSFGFGERKLLKKLNFTITNGMCLGVLGGNGQGKSTLLKIIGGELRPDSGKVKQAPFLRVVYFDQLRASLDRSLSLRQALGDGTDQVTYQQKAVHIIGWARRFGFLPTELDKPVSELSGGQQARVLLAKLVRQEADLLVLDEPTNDLDIPMLEALESMLLEFEGGVVLVTHDRFMLDEVCTHFLGFDREQTILSYASYEQWQAAFAQPISKQQQDGTGAVTDYGVSDKPKNKSTKLSYKDQREYDQMESKILKAEQRLKEIEREASNPVAHADYVASVRLTTELADAKKQVDELYLRWEELDALKRVFKG